MIHWDFRTHLQTQQEGKSLPLPILAAEWDQPKKKHVPTVDSLSLFCQTLRFKWPFYFGTRILAAWRMLVLNNSNTSFFLVPHRVNNANSVSGIGGAELPIQMQRQIKLWLENESLLFTCNLHLGGRLRHACERNALFKKIFHLFCLSALLLEVPCWMSSCQLMCQAEKVPSHRSSIEKQMYSIYSYRKSKHNPALQVFFLKLPFNSASYDFIFRLKTFEFIGKFQWIWSEGWGYFVLHLLTMFVKGFVRKESLLSSDTEEPCSLGFLSHY